VQDFIGNFIHFNVISHYPIQQ